MNHVRRLSMLVALCVASLSSSALAQQSPSPPNSSPPELVGVRGAGAPRYDADTLERYGDYRRERRTRNTGIALLTLYVPVALGVGAGIKAADTCEGDCFVGYSRGWYALSGAVFASPLLLTGAITLVSGRRRLKRRLMALAPHVSPSRGGARLTLSGRF